MVQVYDMKGAWTRSNRTVLLGLYDGFIKAQTLKRNLSSEALKGFKLDNTRQGYVSMMLTYRFSCHYFSFQSLFFLL